MECPICGECEYEYDEFFGKHMCSGDLSEECDVNCISGELEYWK
jgi:hypothetical protein